MQKPIAGAFPYNSAHRGPGAHRPAYRETIFVRRTIFLDKLLALCDTLAMRYEDAIESTVTRDQAAREIRKHDLNPEDFFKEYGERAEYAGADVLAWLGY
jgi:hypothetical protein